MTNISFLLQTALSSETNVENYNMKVIRLTKNIQTYIFFFDSSSVGMGTGIAKHGYGHKSSARTKHTPLISDHNHESDYDFHFIIPWIRGL